MPPSYIRVRAVLSTYGRGQTDTQTRVTTVHFASCTTHAKCNYRVERYGVGRICDVVASRSPTSTLSATTFEACSVPTTGRSISSCLFIGSTLPSTTPSTGPTSRLSDVTSSQAGSDVNVRRTFCHASNRTRSDFTQLIFLSTLAILILS